MQPFPNLTTSAKGRLAAWSDRLAWHFLTVVMPILRVTRGTSTLLLPPASPGGLGDEALVTVLLQRLNVPKVLLIEYDGEHQWSSLFPPHTGEVAFRGRKGAGQFLKLVWRSHRLYCLGNDALDGYYSPGDSHRRLRMCRLAARAGRDVYIVNLSWNDQPDPLALKALQDLPRSVSIVPRDHVSLERLEKATGRAFALGADLAFLLQPQTGPTTEAATAWAEEQRGHGRPLIGVGANSILASSLGHARYVEAMSELIRRLVDRGCSIMLLAHDFRGHPSDEDLLLSLAERHPSSHVHAFTEPHRASEVKALAALLDFAFPGRFHLALACLSQEIPIIAFSYQGKFEGLMTELGISGLLHPIEMLEDPERAAGTVLEALAYRGEHMRTLKESVPRMVARAEAALEI